MNKFIGKRNESFDFPFDLLNIREVHVQYIVKGFFQRDFKSVFLTPFYQTSDVANKEFLSLRVTVHHRLTYIDDQGSTVVP